jgi:hypothetical protein
MTTSQSNKLTMYETVLKTLQAQANAWKDAVVFTEAVNQLVQLLPLIREAGATGATSLKGVTEAKRTKKEEMANRTRIVAGLASAYAAKTQNLALQAALDFSFSELLRAKDNLAIDRCTAVTDQIRPHLPQLDAYGVTADDFKRLEADIAAFRALIGAKGQQQISRNLNTQRLTERFRRADDLLRSQLDKLMLRYQVSHRPFYDAYLASRVIRDLGGRRPAPVAKAA